MKTNIFLGLLLVLYLFSCNNDKPKSFILEGEITGVADSTPVVLYYLTSRNDKWLEVEDTVYLKDGNFTFKGDIEELTAAYLDFDNTFIRFCLEPVKMKLKLIRNRPWEYELSGTELESENKELRKRIRSKEEELYQELSIVSKIIEQLNSPDVLASERDSLIRTLGLNSAKIHSFAKQMDIIRLNYILENNTSKMAPYLLYTMAKWSEVGADTLRSAYHKLPNDSKNSTLGKLANKQLEQNERLRNGKDIVVGSVAPNFSGTDFSGKNIRLTDINQQSFILIDFWASWCKPCLAQTGQLQKIHNRYSDKGLKIVGISTDENREQWENAVVKYKLGDWYQLLSIDDSEHDYFAFDISDSYGVESIPAYFLIDKQGVVVARWQHLEEEQIAFIEKMVNEEPVRQ